MKNVRQGVWLVPLLVVLIAAAALSHHGATAEGRSQTQAKQVELEYLPSVTNARLTSLGHQSALADLFWIRGVLYFAGQLKADRNFKWLHQYVELIIELDPGFLDAYRWGGTVMVISSSKVTFENVMLANDILEKGTEAHPKDWRLAESAAANCSYYVKKPTEEQRKRLKECQRKFIEIAASRPGAPYTMTLLAASLAEGDDQRMCELLIDAYFSKAEDPVLRRQIENRMTGGLCGEVSTQMLRRQEERFLKAHQTNYPYLPADLMVHVVALEDTESQREEVPEGQEPSDDTLEGETQ